MIQISQYAKASIFLQFLTLPIFFMTFIPINMQYQMYGKVMEHAEFINKLAHFIYQVSMIPDANLPHA